MKILKKNICIKADKWKKENCSSRKNLNSLEVIIFLFKHIKTQTGIRELNRGDGSNKSIASIYFLSLMLLFKQNFGKDTLSITLSCEMDAEPERYPTFRLRLYTPAEFLKEAELLEKDENIRSFPT